MRAKLIYESRGADLDVSDAAGRLYDEIERGWNGRDVTLDCELRCKVPDWVTAERKEGDEILYSVSVMFLATPYRYEGFTGGNDTGGCCGINDTPDLANGEEFAYDELFTVYIPMYDYVDDDGDICGDSEEKLKSTLAHELMHTKTTIRELVQAKDNPQKRNGLSKYTTPSTAVNYNSGHRSPDPDMLDKAKYMLSPTEMKSYVQSAYDTVKGAIEHEMAFDDGDIGMFDKEWLESSVVNSSDWREIEEIEKYLNTGKAVRDAEVSLRKLSVLKNNKYKALRHITGVSTGADFVKYMKKRIKEFKAKYVKASYAAYADTLNKYREKQ